MQERQRLFIAVAAIASVLVVLGATYIAGLSRGRAQVESMELTATAARESALSVVVVPTDTPTVTPTPTDTATPVPTFTPTPTYTPTPLPASPEEWSERFRQNATDALNSMTTLDFTPERAEALLRRVAQGQSLVYVPVSHALLNEDPWAALVTPRTPEGKALPLLFWRDGNAGNRFLSLPLGPIFGDGAPDYSTLRSGIRSGVMRTDAEGRTYVLLIERPNEQAALSGYLLLQAEPGADFRIIWRSRDDPLWSQRAMGTTVVLEEVDDQILPDLVIDGAALVDSPLRDRVDLAGVWVEEPPFAEQRAATRWTPIVADSGPIAGYRLEQVEVEQTPMTALGAVLERLQVGDVTGAAAYANRIDLLQAAFELGLGNPGRWMAIYLDDQGRTAPADQITPRLRFFDNGNRDRTYEALFELDDGGIYRISELVPAAAYTAADLVTPAPPLPTLPPTNTPTTTPTGTATPAPATTADASGSPTPAIATPDGDLLFTLTDTLSITGVIGGELDTVLVPTAPPDDTSTPTVTPTPTETQTPTPAVTSTPTPSLTPLPTATGTPTNTSTPTATPTETPLPIPEIPPGQAAPATGVMFVFEPARLRGAPSLNSVVIAAVDNELPVEIFGITEAGDWLLIRIPARNNVLGWMFRDLVFTNDDLARVPRYRADGISVLQELAPTPVPGTDTPTPTPTPRTTPVLDAPPDADQGTGARAPAPLSSEVILTVADAGAPRDPRQPFDVIAQDGRPLYLDLAEAQIELWGGLAGPQSPDWIDASYRLVDPGTRLYVEVAGAPDPGRLAATRVRVVEPAPEPAGRRVELVAAPDAGRAVGAEDALAMTGGALVPGVFLLNRAGRLEQNWPAEKNAAWLTGDDAAGMVLALDTPGTLPHDTVLGFTWMRTDGSGLRIYAQPFHTIHGVAGDPFGGIWWVEAPTADLDQWQLWHYDPSSRRLLLRLIATGELFGSAGSVSPALTPQLIGAEPIFAPGERGVVAGVDLIVDTFDRGNQARNTGLYRVQVELDEDGRGGVEQRPQLLIAPGSYQDAVRLSPNGDRLAFLVYDRGHPSLTSGIVAPANVVKLLTLSGRGASTVRTLYATESAYEFLAPDIQWLDNNRLVLARGRFGGEGTLSTDLFAVTQLELPDAAAGTLEGAALRSYVLANQEELVDFAACRDGDGTLLIIRDREAQLTVMGWDSVARPQPFFRVPEPFDEAYICWGAGRAIDG